MPVTPEAFWDRIAPAYSKQAIADEEAYARKLAATQALMQPDMTVLELGCGTGTTAIKHAAHVARVDATDISAAMIAIGKQRADEAGVNNVHFRQAAMEDIDAPEGSYDMVLALNLIHLLPDREAALATIHRLLKPGGVFVSSTVCLSDKMWYMRPVIKVMQWLGKAPYVSFVRANTFLGEVASAGFKEQARWSHGRATSLFLITRKADN